MNGKKVFTVFKRWLTLKQIYSLFSCLLKWAKVLPVGFALKKAIVVLMMEENMLSCRLTEARMHTLKNRYDLNIARRSVAHIMAV